MKLWSTMIAMGATAVLSLGSAGFAMAGEATASGCMSGAKNDHTAAAYGTNDKEKRGNRDKQTTSSIVETARQSGPFNSLIASARAAGLAETLSNDDPFTVFAPTDEAFAALPEGTGGNLLKPKNKEQIKHILVKHVVDGKMKSKKAAELTQASTLQGAKIAIDAQIESLRINDAKVVKADVYASNGVIHVVDTVLLPTTQSASAE
jgi:uncharacterized surface protein with fasciclin (FAS1) repeats